MFYKKYELSKSLTGDKIFHIARDALDVVRFRETSLKKLKKAIDQAEKLRLAALQQKEKAKEKKSAAAKKTKKKKRLLASKPTEEVVKEKEEGKEESQVEAQAEPQEELPKKKSFWKRLA